jgi:hypothetical protein
MKHVAVFIHADGKGRNRLREARHAGVAVR